MLPMAVCMPNWFRTGISNILWLTLKAPIKIGIHNMPGNHMEMAELGK